MNQKRKLLPRAHGGAADASHRRPNDSSRDIRRRHRLRLTVLATIAALVTAAVAPAGTSAARSAASPIERGGSAHDSTEDRVHDQDPKKPEDKKSITLRIRLGQTLSLRTLEPLESGDDTAPGKAPRRGRPGESWSLVASPANSELTHQPGAPTFTPDIHGTYIFERKPGKAHGVGATRTLILDVEPVERLLCVNTRVWLDGEDPTKAPPRMKVGDTEYLRTSPDPRALQVVVLERVTTGEPNDDTVTNTTYPFNETTGYPGYSSDISKLGNTHLVLVSGSVFPGFGEQVWGPLERLGAADRPVPAHGLTFSFIGIPGISKGSAWQTEANPDTEGNTRPTSCDPHVNGPPATNLSGWLTHDTTAEAYTYVSPDFVDFDTEASAPSGEHAIRVGNRTYTTPAGPIPGFHALILDRRALCPETTPATECDPGPPLLNQAYTPFEDVVDDPLPDLDMMNATLAPWSNNPDVLLFLAPVAGKEAGFIGPLPVDLITTLGAFGASPLAPGRSLGGDLTKYALVGGGMDNGLPAGSAKPIVAESFTGFGQTGHIAGTLVRDHQNRFGPRQASLTGTPLDRALGEIVYGPTSHWPQDGDPVLEAAFAYLSGDRLGFPVGTQYPHGVRDQYLAWNTEASVPDPNTALSDAWCTTDRPATVDATACATVLHELHNEFLEVKYVDHFLERLKTAYTEVEGENAGQDIIRVVENDIKKDLTPPPAKTSLALGLAHFVLSILSVIPEAGEIFEVAGAHLDLAESLSTDSDGSSADPMQTVYDTGDDLLDATDAAFATAVKQIDAYQPLIVSDHAKLTLVGHLSALAKFQDGTDLPTTPWVITNDDLARARTGLEQALKQWLYPTLVDAGFPVWRIVIPSSDGFNQTDRTPVTYRCSNRSGIGVTTTHPFGAEPDDGWIKLNNGHDNYYLALGGTRFDPEEIEFDGHHAPVPDAALLTEMFGPLPDHVGIDPTWYFEHFFKRQLGTGGDLVIDCLKTE
jgi:hypothetical protein